VAVFCLIFSFSRGINWDNAARELALNQGKRPDSKGKLHLKPKKHRV